MVKGKDYGTGVYLLIKDKQRKLPSQHLTIKDLTPDEVEARIRFLFDRLSETESEICITHYATKRDESEA